MMREVNWRKGAAIWKIEQKGAGVIWRCHCTLVCAFTDSMTRC